MKFTTEGIFGKIWGNADSAAEAPEWEGGISQYFGKCNCNGLIAVIWRIDTLSGEFASFGRCWIIQVEDLAGPDDGIDFVQCIIPMEVYADIEYVLKLHFIYESLESSATITPVFTVNDSPTTYGFHSLFPKVIIEDGVIPTFERPDGVSHVTGLSNNWFSVGHNESLGVGPLDVTYSWPKVGTTEGAYDIFDGRVEETIFPPFTVLEPEDSDEIEGNILEILTVPGINSLHIHAEENDINHFSTGMSVEIGDLNNNYNPSETLPIILTIFDDAPDPMPDVGELSTGDYRPTSFSGEDTDGYFPSPAPASPYPKPAPADTDTFASVFTGIDPNGQWDLYVVDTAGGDEGEFTSGWSLNIITGSDDETFYNLDTITIPDVGEATPYPSSITVAGVTGTVTDVRVMLNLVAHTFPADISILLVSPTGEKFVIMSACFAP